jgi:prevent-host-death family protein
MEITATELRNNLYKILDRVLENGEEITIRRKGKKIRMIDASPKRRSDRLVPHDTIVGDPEELVSLKVWEWNEERNLEGLP